METALVVGFEEVVNDPHVWRHGVRVGVGVAPVQWVEVAVAGVYYPITGFDPCGGGDFKPSACEAPYFFPPSRLMGQLQAVARVLPIYGEVAGCWIWVGGHAGFALVAHEYGG